MSTEERIFVLGAGAVGLPLAACLAAEGRPVVSVRTRPGNPAPPGPATFTIRQDAEHFFESRVERASFSDLSRLDGIIVVTTKSYANPTVAHELRRRQSVGPIVVLQNGLGVERPFLDAGFDRIYRAVLYVTSLTTGPIEVTFRQIASSPVGAIRGPEDALEGCVAALTTPRFQFHTDPEIERAIWKKTIINSVFNSICPLLEADNGIFVRNPEVTRLAEIIVAECVEVARRRGLELPASEVMEQIFKISHGSGGVLISTLQDLRTGRETEIESLNLELARVANSMDLRVEKTELLGRMIAAKSRLRQSAAQ